MKKHMMALGLLLLGLGSLSLQAAASVSSFGLSYDPGPELDAPCTDNFDLKGKDVLTFRWQPVMPSQLRHYIFKLYRGYQTVEANLILKKELPGRLYSFPFPAGELSAGRVYTWELRGVFLDGSKTDTSFCSFQIKNE